MGRVRTKTVKKASRVIIEKYYTKLTHDFHSNKRICEEIAVIPSKKMRNRIAGYATQKFFKNSDVDSQEFLVLRFTLVAERC